jgi:magnesium-protoporphyrin IX monomethyl ester (oxidative) cyclase
LILRANPHLLKGANTLWIRFFLLAVFATMYVRDHGRVEMHAAMRLDPTDYDFAVFRITSEISRQVFPLSLDIEDPRFRAGLDRLCRLSAALQRAKARGGLVGRLQQARLALAGAATFVRLYSLPVKRHSLPAQIHLAPAW